MIKCYASKMSINFSAVKMDGSLEHNTKFLNLVKDLSLAFYEWPPKAHHMLIVNLVEFLRVLFISSNKDLLPD